MILEITTFDHPSLRTPGARVESFDKSLRVLVEDMVETMVQADGLGLAAQQVGLPFQLFVLDVPQLKKRPSAMRIDGKPVDFSPHMPIALINSEVVLFGKTSTESEGCLSFPEITVHVARPLSVQVKATLVDGTPLEFEADGLLARAIQHELDHTRGVLFIDHATEADRDEFPAPVRRLIRPLA